MLCCPALQSLIVIWLVFVAFISGGSVVAITACRCGVAEGSVLCTRSLGGCLPRYVVKTAMGFVTDRCGFFFPGTLIN